MQKKPIIVDNDAFEDDVSEAAFEPEGPHVNVPNPAGKMNPTHQPLGTNIPNLPQGDYDPRHIIGKDRGGTFLRQAGRETVGQAKAIADDPRAYATGFARKWPAVMAGMGGGEAVQQIRLHARDAIERRRAEKKGKSYTPEAPQTSGEAAWRILKSIGLGAAFKGAFSVAGKLDKRAAEKAAKVVEEKALEKFHTKEAAKLEDRIKMDEVLLTERADDAKVYKREKAQETRVEKDKIRADTNSSIEATKGHDEFQLKYEPESLSPSAKRVPSRILTEEAQAGKNKTRSAISAARKEQFTIYENEPAIKTTGVNIGRTIKDSSEEITNVAPFPPALAKRINDLPDVVSVKSAVDLLSDITTFARTIPGVGRNKAQGFAARLTKELYPQIDSALAKHPEALAALKKGRALHKLEHDLFERAGATAEGTMGGQVRRGIENKTSPEVFAKKGLDAMNTYLAQTGMSAKDFTQHALDSIIKSSTKNGTLSRSQLTKELAKYPDDVQEVLFGPATSRFGNSAREALNKLASGDKITKETLSALKKTGNAELLKVTRQSQRISEQDANSAQRNARELRDTIAQRAERLARHKEALKKASDEAKPKGMSKRTRTALKLAGAAAAGAGGSAAYSNRRFLYPAYRVVRSLTP